MINFFRNIRRKLANENKFQKYFRYAFGEVFLVVIGILIALQANNWNEKRKQEAQFKTTLEQLYNSIAFDVQKFESDFNWIGTQIKFIDSILDHKNSLNKHNLPYLIYGTAYNQLVFFNSETPYHAQNLNFNINDKSQNEIAKQIINYVNDIDKNPNVIVDRMTPLAMKYNIAFPKFNTNSRTGGFSNDSLYYDEEDYKNAFNLINSKEFETIARQLEAELVFSNTTIFNRYQNGKSILKLIKTYNPDVKILYYDVGIIGTSIDGFDDVGAKSTPMALSDIENDIWELNIFLKAGKVKFRCRDSWSQNWGSNNFPKGVGLRDGYDIDIPEAGNYKIIFKPVTGEYEFIKQKD